jgi:hypothetical protein
MTPPSHPTPLEVLRGARELISDPERWTQGEYARNAEHEAVNFLSPEACRWCLVGALAKASGRDPDDHEPAMACVAHLLRPWSRNVLVAITSFNDESEHAKALALLDEAIAAEAGRGG